MSKRNKGSARGKRIYLPFKAITGDHPRFSGVWAESTCRVEQDKQGGLRSKVNLILRNKAVNEETGSEPSRVVPPKGRTSEREERSGEDADRWEEAKQDERRGTK